MLRFLRAIEWHSNRRRSVCVCVLLGTFFYDILMHAVIFFSSPEREDRKDCCNIRGKPGLNHQALTKKKTALRPSILIQQKIQINTSHRFLGAKKRTWNIAVAIYYFCVKRWCFYWSHGGGDPGAGAGFLWLLASQRVSWVAWNPRRRAARSITRSIATASDT